ncbi:hypothetical protein BT96DRAFT_926249 [Gymnopus androsaceus JB14]|uniref:Uncharacterized protein n=1 Tax=Gymnopus androsaceus JB14 TaxID=1447944 RepID=A0A6A4GXZ0_9AGAR|nr:hypothetical protein BT96DRAFT_926249 [Gymnopus androsaceus JB14]
MNREPSRLSTGLCSEVSFDPDRDTRVVILFLRGSTILLPSSLFTHPTLPIQEHETGYAAIPAICRHNFLLTKLRRRNQETETQLIFVAGKLTCSRLYAGAT